MKSAIVRRAPFASALSQYIAVLSIVALLGVAALPAYAQKGSKQNSTRLRLEVSGYRAFDAGKANGDYYLSGAVELEVPVVDHATLGLRLLPLFLYPDEGDHAEIHGIAAGLGGRLYTNAENRGVFIEGGASALWSMDKLHIDDSRVGFLGDCGIGYQFNSGVHLSIKAQHISDTGIGEVSGGTSGLGLAAGFSF